MQLISIIPPEIKQQIAGDLIAGVNRFEALNKGVDKLLLIGLTMQQAYIEASEYIQTLNQA